MKLFLSEKKHSRHYPIDDDVSPPKYKPNFGKIDREKQLFLKEFSSKYGYKGRIDKIREKEYPQLNSCVYLDHTGATVYAQSTVTEFAKDLTRNLYGNPHSRSPSSIASSKRIEQVRKRVLKFFQANEQDYTIIFTQNATASAKLVGEMFPWTSKSSYKYLRESHNSVIGLRRFSEQISAEFQAVTEDDVNLMIKERSNFGFYDQYENDDGEITYNLFAYPAQCNYSGMKFPLNWVRK